jgi:hypothetical protein
VAIRTPLFSIIRAIAIALALAALSNPLGPERRADAARTTVTARCKGANLAGAFVANNLGAGNALITIAVTNVGTSACRLGGYPALLGIRGATSTG